MRKIIGLMGFAGAGKNTIANALGFQQAAFADAIKSDVAPLLAGLGLDVAKREDKIKARELMVAYGKLARSVDPNYWIGRLDLKLESEGEPLVITDVRYLNEVKYILQHLGGSIVLVIRRGTTAANEEEARKYVEIFNAKDAGEIDYQVVYNNYTPEEAATDVQEACGLNLPRKTIPHNSYLGRWVSATGFVKGGFDGKTVAAYVIDNDVNLYHIEFTDGTTDDRHEDYIYVHLLDMIDDGTLIAAPAEAKGHAAETARRFNANEPYRIADDGWDTAPASKSAIFDDDYDAEDISISSAVNRPWTPPAVEAEVIEANLDAEAAILAHPTWQKLQQYPANVPSELIEEVPHTISIPNYVNWTDYTNVARFREREHVLLQFLKWLVK